MGYTIRQEMSGSGAVTGITVIFMSGVHFVILGVYYRKERLECGGEVPGAVIVIAWDVPIAVSANHHLKVLIWVFGVVDNVL